MGKQIAELMICLDDWDGFGGSLEFLAENLADPDSPFGGDERAVGGDRFRASVFQITEHFITRTGVRLLAKPELPQSYTQLAVRYGQGLGWSEDDLYDDLEAVGADYDDLDSGEYLACLVAQPGDYEVIYHASPPRCELVRLDAVVTA